MSSPPHTARFATELPHSANTFESYSTVPAKWRKRRVSKWFKPTMVKSGSFGVVTALVPQRHVHMQEERAFVRRPHVLSENSTFCDDPQDVECSGCHGGCIVPVREGELNEHHGPNLPLSSNQGSGLAADSTGSMRSSCPLVCKECRRSTLGVHGSLPAEFLHEVATVWQLTHMDPRTAGWHHRTLLPRPVGMVVPKSYRSAPRLVMEEGGISLQMLLTNPPCGQVLSPQEQRQVIGRVVHHVLFLWRVLGLVHLDLKPQNIVVANFRDPHQPLQVRLVDWGASASITRLREVPLVNHVTTMWFEAPEAVLELPQAGLPQDKWSLGCVIWAICFHGSLPAAGGTFIEHFWQQCRMFGTPTATDRPWRTQSAARRAARRAPRWPCDGAVLGAKRAQMNGIWAGLGDMVCDGLLQMDPARRWSTHTIASRMEELGWPAHLPRRHPWRVMRDHPTVPWEPTQRAARGLMLGHTRAERHPVPMREARLLLLHTMLAPLQGGHAPQVLDHLLVAHPLFAVFAMQLLDTVVCRMCPFQWKQHGLLHVQRLPQRHGFGARARVLPGAVEEDSGGSETEDVVATVAAASQDAQHMAMACFMVALKWFSEHAIDSEVVGDMFHISSHRTLPLLVELERDIVRACPDMLGIEGDASAYRALQRRLGRVVDGDVCLTALGTALLMHVMLTLPALWVCARPAVVRDIERILTRMREANDTWSVADFADVAWLRAARSKVPVADVWWQRSLVHIIEPQELEWVRRTLRYLLHPATVVGGS